MRRKIEKGIVHLGGNRYEVSVWITNPKTGKGKRGVRIVTATSRAEARRKRDGLRDELRAERKPAGRLTFRGAAISWLRTKLSAWKASTRKNHASIIDNDLVPELGDYYVDAITADDIVRWRTKQVGAPATVNSRLRLLRQILADVLSPLGLPSPAARVDGIREALDEEREVYYLDAGEARSVLEWLRDSKGWQQWYPLVATLALTGLRFGEASALRWSDIDETRGWIHVRRAQWKRIVDHPKSEVAKRDIPLAPELVAILRAHRIAQIKRKQRGLETGYVFLSRVGTLHDNSVLQKPIAAALKAKKIGGRFPAAHGWRKVHNNILRQVADEAVRQALIGHADAETGRKHYSRASEDELRAASARVVRLVTGGA